MVIEPVFLSVRRVVMTCRFFLCLVPVFYASDRCSGGIMFLACPSVSACGFADVRPSVSPGMHPVGTMCYKPVDRISPNFG